MHVTWNLPDGGTITAEVNTGLSLMEAAVANDVPNVIGECGGCLSCATCHVYVHEAWRDKVGAPGETEDVMLDMVAGERTEASRLSCQIEASEALDGLVLIVPQV
ncbi:MAG: 2Fe-2S iron-sulfur cluster-binding protein [Pseudodonghicola sp.]|nr:2Fe-2S iron-sulfur cluster-binding protein [Pseudodonghicola sp.]